MRKDLRQVVRQYAKHGFRVSRTKGGHLRFEGPNGELVFGASTPSDYRSLKNLKAQLDRVIRSHTKAVA
jgi:predicted RNA binding protein YcfA (HicA-like mRNA interferase family)